MTQKIGLIFSIMITPIGSWLIEYLLVHMLDQWAEKFSMIIIKEKGEGLWDFWKMKNFFSFLYLFVYVEVIIETEIRDQMAVWKRRLKSKS